MLVTGLVFLIILSGLVLIHEAGHYFVAKWFGIKVEEFGFGLPPRLWGKRRGETIYSVNWLPIGGFVKLYGEDEAGAGRITVKSQKFTHPLTPSQEGEMVERAFYSRSAWQRVSVIVAGVVMNALLAVVIYYVFLGVSHFQTELPLLGKPHFFGVNERVVTNVLVSKVEKGSPAERAGLTDYSKIVSVNGERITTTERFLVLIKQNKGKPVNLEWQDVKTSKVSRAMVTPRVKPPKGQGALGVGFFPMESVVLSYDSVGQKIFSGFVHPANLLVYNFVVLGDLVGVSVKEKTMGPLSEGVSGPVGIFSLVGTIIGIPDVRERFLQVLNLAGLLSISLAFFNVLPIPGLDGGRLFFIVVELVIGRKVNQKFEGYAHAVGMLLLIGLILLITFKDVMQLLR